MFTIQKGIIFSISILSTTFLTKYAYGQGGVNMPRIEALSDNVWPKSMHNYIDDTTYRKALNGLFVKSVAAKWAPLITRSYIPDQDAMIALGMDSNYKNVFLETESDSLYEYLYRRVFTGIPINIRSRKLPILWNQRLYIDTSDSIFVGLKIDHIKVVSYIPKALIKFDNVVWGVVEIKTND